MIIKGNKYNIGISLYVEVIYTPPITQYNRDWSDQCGSEASKYVSSDKILIMF